MHVDSFGDDRGGFPNWLGMLLVALAVAAAFFFWQRRQPLPADPEAPVLRADMATDDAELAAIATTLRALQPEGAQISNILVERGIRAGDGEIPTPGEIKILFNLHWPSLPGRPSRREALDRTAARAVIAVLAAHPQITKVRILLKVPKQRRETEAGSLSVARGHETAAKVFSFTRSAFEAAATLESAPRRKRRRAVPLGDRMVLPSALLAFGDYVVLEDGEWKRGY